MPSLSDCLLVSDIDGTALIAEQGIPPQNIEAARRFTQRGGRFTFATGRAPEIARPVVDAFPVNAPLILLNGAIIVDPVTYQILREHLMPPGIHAITEDIVRELDGFAGVMMVDVENYYAVSASPDSIRICTENVMAHPVVCPVQAVPEKVYKLLLAVREEKDTPALREKVGRLYGDAFNVVQSGERYVELLPRGVSKGDTLLELAQMLSVDIRNTAAIGDNENDRRLLACAGISAAPADAHSAAREQAGRIMCRCMDGALAQFIQELLQEYDNET